jgi:hypothetical protein
MRGVFSPIPGIIGNRCPDTISPCDCLLPCLIAAAINRDAIGKAGGPESAKAAVLISKLKIRDLFPFDPAFGRHPRLIRCFHLSTTGTI